ncbi:MAG: hypothetical protein SGILL_007186 [Bacillariaceae sp.]
MSDQEEEETLLTLESHVIDFLNDQPGLEDVVPSSSSLPLRPAGSKLDVVGDMGVCNLVALNFFSGVIGGDDPELRYVYGPAFEMAFATMLAVQHLNQGDGSIVPELSGLNETCPIRFIPEYQDTGGLEPTRALSVVQDVLVRPGATNYSSTCPLEDGATMALPPCAFVGAYESSISQLTAPLTGFSGYPQVSGTSAQDTLDNKDFFPKFARTIPSQIGASVALVDYLLRDDVFREEQPYLAILHIDDDFGNSYVSRIREVVKEYNDNQIEAIVDTSSKTFYVESIPLDPSGKDIVTQIRKLKKLDFRTVFAVLTGQYDFHNAVAMEAYRQKVVGTGKEVWYYAEDSVVPILSNYLWPTNSSLDVAYRGSGIIWPGTGDVDDIYLRFAEQLQQLRDTPAIMEFMLSALPMTKGINETDLLLGLQHPYFLSATGMDPRLQFVYEATVLLGLAACEAVTDDLYLDGDTFFKDLLATDFHGISGKIVLDQNTGTRAANSSVFAMLNIIENEDPTFEQALLPFPTDFFENQEWPDAS